MSDRVRTADGFSTKTRSRIGDRDGGRCVCCGMPGREKHHRRRRNVDHDGLAHSPANGLTFCGWGNHTGCHGKVHSNPTWAKACGYIVPPEESPLEVPVRHYSRGLILLDGDGGWKPVEVRSSPSPQTTVRPLS